MNTAFRFQIKMFMVKCSDKVYSESSEYFM